MSRGSASRVHGGRAPEGFIDFSAPLNPLAPPPFVLHELVEALRTVGRYPDPDYRRLVEAASTIYSTSVHIIPLNGAAEGYSLVVACTRPRRVVVLEPTFGDRDLDAMCSALGIEVVHVDPRRRGGGELRYGLEEIEELDLGRSDLVILSDPCNPLGTCLEPSDLKLLDEVSSRATVLLDEAFKSLTRCVEARPREGLLVLRSMTKELGVPGLRIGFLLVEDEKLYTLLNACRQPWNVNSLASYVVSRIAESYLDEYRAFLEISRSFIDSERRWLADRLRRLRGVRVFDSEAPYILIEHRALPHPRLQQRLAGYRVYVRDCSSFYGLGPEYSRISVRLRHENEVLVKALEGVLAWV